MLIYYIFHYVNIYILIILIGKGNDTVMDRQVER